MSRSPVDVPDELFDRLREHFDEAQLVELTNVIAIENYRARFNWAFGIEGQGFTEGAFCVPPEARPEARFRRGDGAGPRGRGSSTTLDCGFCRWALGWVLRWDRGRALEPIALQDPRGGRAAGADEPGADDGLLAPGGADGSVASAGAAAAPLLAAAPRRARRSRRSRSARRGR